MGAECGEGGMKITRGKNVPGRVKGRYRGPGMSVLGRGTVRYEVQE